MDRLFFVIANRGKANTVLRKAKEFGLTEGTILPGESAIQNRFLERLGLTEVHKDIVTFPTTENLFNNFYKEMLKSFKRNELMAFSIPFKRWQPHSPGYDQINISKKDINPSHYCIMTIVDKGRGKACVKAARSAGATSAFVIRGHGAGIPADFYFPLVIEPQKDIIMIVTEEVCAPAIRKKIFSDLELGKVGSGIIFSLPVSWTGGFYEKVNDKVKEKPS